MHKTYGLEELNNIQPQSDLHKVVEKFIGGEPKPERFETRDCYPLQSNKQLAEIAERLQKLKISTNLSFAPKRVCYVYDVQMTEHRNLFEE